ncbi:hypothetical protein [Pantoea sp.]|uniref:hypothetical protein n=1 Tax=Pantoea sp. TaxID=69393 RepID=UPI0028B23B93|nr:hypothetical protein [Pantoea sp.]
MSNPAVTQKDMDEFKRNSLRKTPIMEITLRDYMAAKYMQGTISAGGIYSQADLAKEAYQMADAMLVVRKITLNRK